MSEEVLSIVEKRREAKGKGEQKQYTQWTWWQKKKKNLNKILANQIQKYIKRIEDFPGIPVVKASPFTAGVWVQSLMGELKIPHASQSKNQNIKQKQCCNKFNKYFLKK